MLIDIDMMIGCSDVIPVKYDERSEITPM